MYNDILKKLQGGFLNPNTFGKPGGFANQSFNFNDPDVIKPGGGPGFPGESGDPDVPTGTSPTSPTSNTGQYSSTQYGGQFGTQFQDMGTLLGNLGQAGFNFYDPGSKYGFGSGSGYEDYFAKFDTVGYGRAMEALKELESSSMKQIGSLFEGQKDKLGSQLETSLLELTGETSTRGLLSGRAQSRRQDIYGAGGRAMERLGVETEGRYQDVQQMVGQQLGQLEGTLVDYLSGVSQTALQLEQSDATKMEAGGAAATSIYNIPRGNAYSADSPALQGFRGMFDDLGTQATAAWNAFVQASHDNLNPQHLSELAYSIYNQYQTAEEEEAIGG